MKKRVATIALLLMCLSVPAWAQEGAPKAEVFAGVSLLSAKFNDVARNQAVGWQGSIAGNLTKDFGFLADFGGNYKTIEGTDLKIYPFLFGPQVSRRMKKMTVFGHALAGVVHINESDSGGSNSETHFAMGWGGGLDMKTKSITVRVLQVDWVPVQVNDSRKTWETSPWRAGIGIVIPVKK
jgi:hypothetical protein